MLVADGGGAVCVPDALEVASVEALSVAAVAEPSISLARLHSHRILLH